MNMRIFSLSLTAWLLCSGALAAEPEPVVTTDPQSQPESFSETPDGSLFIGSASKPIIYRTEGTPYLRS